MKTKFKMKIFRKDNNYMIKSIFNYTSFLFLKNALTIKENKISILLEEKNILINVCKSRIFQYNSIKNKSL